jgi:cytidylate kinase
MSAADYLPELEGDDPSRPIEVRESPRHGFQGDRVLRPAAPLLPCSLTVAISREAGSRGGTIARRVGRKLGWQVYNQELLEYIAQEGAFHQNLAESLSAAAAQWVEERLQLLLREQNLSQHPSIVNMARTILTLGVQGEVVLIGRGAGCILPPQCTLRVRIMAPLADRIAYMSQWMRMTVEEAAEQVRLRDDRRAEFIAMHFHRHPSDIYQYDLLLNSTLLGEDACAELIAQAARAKLMARQPDVRLPTPPSRGIGEKGCP